MHPGRATGGAGSPAGARDRRGPRVPPSPLLYMRDMGSSHSMPHTEIKMIKEIFQPLLFFPSPR